MVKQRKISPSACPPATGQSVQLDLFSQFITNNTDSVSNSIEVWENIPKYFFTKEKTASLRTEEEYAAPYEWSFLYNNEQCAIKIQPALIKQKDGTYKAFFPTKTEENIEEALKKILTEQNQGIHDFSKKETWVRFTLTQIYNELKKRKRTRNYDEIKHAIEVMSSCVLTFYIDNKEIWKGSILQDLVTVGRKKYLSDTSSQHAARLPLFISQSINNLEYRQFNYDRLMSCNEQLSKWIYKRLINRYKQASLLNDYHFTFSDLKQHSGLLQQKRDTDNRKKVISAFNELQKNKVISHLSLSERKKGRIIIDVVYTVKASIEFISEQKAANKRVKDSLFQQTRLKLATNSKA